jgi:hypothetical protein
MLNAISTVRNVHKAPTFGTFSVSYNRSDDNNKDKNQETYRLLRNASEGNAKDSGGRLNFASDSSMFNMTVVPQGNTFAAKLEAQKLENEIADDMQWRFKNRVDVKKDIYSNEKQLGDKMKTPLGEHRKFIEERGLIV